MTNAESIRLTVHKDDVFLRDADDRAWLLRGVNLSGSCKFPRHPTPVPSHVGGDAFWGTTRNVNGHPSNEMNPNGDLLHYTNGHANKHEPISFVGRPFELSEADEHLGRLRHWGFRMIRWVVTWEAIEHAGPGQYDQEFLDYTVKALLKAKEFGFKVMIDFHQDVWSRYSGGSGAPLWTFYAAGLDPQHFAATGAASVHNTLREDEPLLRMVWLTNYFKLACATMFTLFYAGKRLAPQCTLESGVNIQEYLQRHFIQSIDQLVQRIHTCRDSDGINLLEDSVVIGYDSWNEPSGGWIGLKQLEVLPEEHDMRQGDMPTPFQSLMLGEGMPVENVDVYGLELVGPVKKGSRTINPSSYESTLTNSPGDRQVKAWLTKEKRDEMDATFGIARDTTFPRAHECIWAQHNVWSIKSRRVLDTSYFQKGPNAHKDSIHPIRWVEDHWMPFAKRVTDIVRQTHPTAILFLEPPVYVPPPDLITFDKSTRSLPLAEPEEDPHPDELLTTNMVYTPHHYDDLVLLTKKYLGFINIDLLGLSRGRHSSLVGSIVVGKKSTEALFGKQIGEIQQECNRRLGRRPVLIGETGLHFDVGLDSSLQAGTKAAPATSTKNTSWLSGLLGGNKNKEAQQPVKYPRTATTTSKQFQKAFDNILNGLDRNLIHYTLWNYTIENDAEFGDGWNGENLSLYSRASAASAVVEGDRKVVHPMDVGGRAVEQFCRPYPVATVGEPIRIDFDRHSSERRFLLETRTTKKRDQMAEQQKQKLRTEIYVPRIHYESKDRCEVRVSDGKWEWDEVEQLLWWEYGVLEGKEGGDLLHWITVQRKR